VTDDPRQSYERLRTIKSNAAEFQYSDEILNRDDVLWLVAEIERQQLVLTHIWNKVMDLQPRAKVLEIQAEIDMVLHYQPRTASSAADGAE
jgi:hypothetical protein